MVKQLKNILIAALVLSAMSGCTVKNNTGKAEQTYQDTLFDQSYVHVLNVDISDEDWNDLLNNPLNKTKYKVNITLDGEKINDVSFATKGNTSLSQVASDVTTDRYSFKINFGKYVDNQTYDGLDKLSLNNLYADATYIKDYLSYKIMAQAGVKAPLTTYISISVNNQPWGLYLGVEDLSDAFLERNYGNESGSLYKPETSSLNGEGNIFDQEKPNDQLDRPADNNISNLRPKMEDSERPATFDNTEDAFNHQPRENDKADGFIVGDDMMSSNIKGADLKYTDDEYESYSDIFDNAETEITDEDKDTLIKALKQLNTNESLAECLNIDGVIKYFVAHNFTLNYDSYTGNMLHNYFLYENNGKLSILPWDYNLAYGGFNLHKGNKDASNLNNTTSIVNMGIDTPLSGTTSEARPLWHFIVSNEEYLTLFHQYFDELITNFFETGVFEKEMTRIYNMIRPYVQEDQTAFYHIEEFDLAYTTLKSFCSLRAQSIAKQLDGIISTDSSTQVTNTLVDASNIKISDMGSQSIKNFNDNKAPKQNEVPTKSDEIPSTN